MNPDNLRSIRYPKVPKAWDQRFLYLAASVAAWSKDPSTKVGAVAVRQRRVLATGYNGLPAGMVDSAERLLNRDVRLALTIHAELNLVTFAARHGVCLEGATVYTYPLLPCSNCATSLIQVGIAKVVSPDFVMPMRWQTSIEQARTAFTEAGVAIELLPIEGPLHLVAASNPDRDDVEETENAHLRLV
ncbi:MAG: dCMP deaminase family protein [Cyanobium sp.]|nr:dCMP deaminase family protein [Cyanobium sp.]